MEDEGKLPVGIRFFKVLIPGFEQALKLPPIISMILNAGEIPEAAFLVTRRGTWKVGVVGGGGEFNNNNSNQGLALTGKGWDSFVKAHYLSAGHFLVFEHSGDMHFNTLVFDSTTCDKEFPDDDKKNINFKRKQDQGTTSASYQKKQGFFQVKLQRYSVQISNPFLYIPETFTNSNRLSENGKVTLINPSGDKWKVNLKIHDHSSWRKNKRPVRCALHSGWKKFVQENKLKVGHICVFEVSRSSGRRNSTVMNVQFIGQ